MSEELVRRLRESPWCQPMKREAADRIAELEAERDEAWNAAIEAAARTCAELVVNEQSFTRWRAALDCSALVRLLTRAAKGGTP